MDDAEQYTRSYNCLITSGVGEKEGECTDELVTNIGKKKLDIELTVQDIDRSHRLGPPPSSGESSDRHEFPFNHSLDDKDFKDSLFEFFQCDKDVNLTRLNNLVLDIFSLNRDDDEEECEFYQFNVPCQYYFSEFHSNSAPKNISLFHLNAQSIPSKYLRIEDLLQSIDHKFDVYAFSETWFEENVPSLFSISDYRFLHKSRKNRRCGGVCLYLQPDFQFKERPDLQFSNDSTDTLFVE